ncbi:hypothetical protein DESUT3_31030 [Desulfuromonas versatilis]|uniref:Rubrerythrin diiron-binding domain-containing protein n=1 Tax=Desulfuromonas versatilis TaxID=2802975 RepID=A0ABM8HVK5_9BACT|nr:ferritin family protein [Desulfuromonas versatilis]BCR06034.1 hypothetical protein DESUT3_31030 [Desulfuromonas versatilis]
MNVYRCRICGDASMESEKPTHCPFCGAHQKHTTEAAEFVPLGTGELAKKSRENLLRALELQTGNSAFYRGASKVADTPQGKALFSALARIAAVHAEITCRILGAARPEELYETGACSPSHKENLAECHKRKERALHLYRRFLDEATEERVRQVLEAFIEIEADHLALVG